MILTQGTKVFVTGGSGFVGRRLIELLRERGLHVRALARSSSSIATVERLGAEAVAGDLDDAAALARGLEGCTAVFHAAAKLDEWGDRREFERINVEATRTLFDLAREAGARRAVHVSTEAALVDGTPLVDVDETRPLPDRAIGLYADSKRLAELVARDASRGDFVVSIVRPRLVWGRGDTSLLPRLVERAREGKLAWIGGGDHFTSTCHVDNVVEGAIAACERGAPGQAYFLTDGRSVRFRAFVSAMLRSQGVEANAASVPRWLAKGLAAFVEDAWTIFGISTPPPVTRMAVLLAGETVTVRDDRARRELGYRPRVDHERGLRDMGYDGPIELT